MLSCCIFRYFSFKNKRLCAIKYQICFQNLMKTLKIGWKWPKIDEHQKYFITLTYMIICFPGWNISKVYILRKFYWNFYENRSCGLCATSIFWKTVFFFKKPDFMTTFVKILKNWEWHLVQRKILHRLYAWDLFFR